MNRKRQLRGREQDQLKKAVNKRIREERNKGHSMTPSDARALIRAGR